MLYVLSVRALRTRTQGTLSMWQGKPVSSACSDQNPLLLGGLRPPFSSESLTSEIVTSEIVTSKSGAFSARARRGGVKSHDLLRARVSLSKNRWLGWNIPLLRYQYAIVRATSRIIFI